MNISNETKNLLYLIYESSNFFQDGNEVVNVETL